MRPTTFWLSAYLYSTFIVAHPNGGQKEVCNSAHSEKPNYHDNAGVLKYVNPHIGTYGTSPNDNGGMIPSVSVPFGSKLFPDCCILRMA